MIIRQPADKQRQLPLLGERAGVREVVTFFNAQSDYRGVSIIQRRTRSLCWNGWPGHNPHENMLDSNFSLNYGRFMKEDGLSRLCGTASIMSFGR